MKRIEAFIQQHRLSKVVNALHALSRFPGFSVLDAHGQGPGRGAGGHYDYGDDSVLYHRHCALVIICEDDEADMLTEVIGRAAHTGNRGDGIITVGEVSRVLRIGDFSKSDQPPANAGAGGGTNQTGGGA